MLLNIRSLVAATVAGLLAGCAVPVAPVATGPQKFETAEESTAVMNLSLVSPENLYVWNTPTFAGNCQLVYSAKQWDQGALGNSVSIWRSPCDGGPATKLVAAGQNESLVTARTSPEASKIHFSLDCQMFSVNKSGMGGRTKLAGSGSCDYMGMPIGDGREILFSSCTTNKDCYWKDSNYIWLMNADGRNMTQLRQGSSPTISPNGKTIAFSYGKDLWIMDRDGGNVTNLTSDARFTDHAPTFSPDGKRLAFVRAPVEGGNADIWMINIDGSNLVQLTMNPAADYAPYWAADNYIYFISNRGELVNGQHANRIWRMRLR